MQDKISEYYKKADRIIRETDAALLTFQEREGNQTVVNTLINPPTDKMDVLQMFRSNYMACKMLLEAMNDDDVKKYGADFLLQAVINMKEPDNVRKMIITK